MMDGIDPWVVGWAAGGAVVLVAALLLLTILAAAAGIHRQAVRARDALRRIDANTKAVWGLARTSRRLGAVRDHVEALAAPGDDGGRQA